MAKMLIVAGYAPSLINFRAPLLKALVAAGHRLMAAAAEDDAVVSQQLAELGIVYRLVPLSRAGTNPLQDLESINAVHRLILKELPDVIFSYTHKAVIYSGLAAGRLTRGPRFYPLITGLGYTFIGRGLKARCAQFVLRFLYRRASKHFTGVFFQNPDDLALFRKLRLIRPETPICIVRGSGIDLAAFPFVPLGEIQRAESGHLKPEVENSKNSEVVESSQVSSLKSQPSARLTRFLLIARLLGDKGIREYVKAAQVIKSHHPEAEFHLIGPTDPNPAAISIDEVKGWQHKGTIIYHGSQADVRPFLRDCTVYVLPSYREGTPRTVLEAMATGRAVITTDAPGCRETVFFGGAGSEERGARSSDIKEGENGFLVPVKSVDALVAAMNRFIEEHELAETMGRAGRRLAEEHYDVHKVNQQMLEFMGLARQPEQGI